MLIADLLRLFAVYLQYFSQLQILKVQKEKKNFPRQNYSLNNRFRFISPAISRRILLAAISKLLITYQKGPFFRFFIIPRGVVAERAAKNGTDSSRARAKANPPNIKPAWG